MVAYDLLHFRVRGDHAGSLVALEKGADFPFDIKRVYYIWGQTKTQFVENMRIENWNRLLFVHLGLVILYLMTDTNAQRFI